MIRLRGIGLANWYCADNRGFTRPNGVSINAPIGAAPANHFTLPLHPDEVVDVEAQSGTVSDIAVMVI